MSHTIFIDSDCVSGWGKALHGHIVRATAARRCELAEHIRAGGEVLVYGCPDDRAGVIGCPSVRRVIIRSGMLLTRVIR